MKKRLLVGLTAGLFLTGMVGVASATTIGQWIGSSRSWNNGAFTTIKSTMTTGGHIVEADEEITAANLLNDGMFVIGEASRGLTSAENSALTNWVAGGGILWIGVDSPSNEAFSNSILSNLGSTISFSSANTGSGSPLIAGNFATNNIYNIVGQSLTLSLGRSTEVGSLGTYISDDILSYEMIGNGYIFAAGDRFEHNFSNSSVSSTNGQLFLNIAAGASSNPVPEPATMLLFGTGLVGLVGLHRRKNKK